MTISISKIFIDYNDAKRLLRNLDIDYIEEKEKATSLRKTDFSRKFIKQSYKDDYREIYRIERKFRLQSLD